MVPSAVAAMRNTGAREAEVQGNDMEEETEGNDILFRTEPEIELSQLRSNEVHQDMTGIRASIGQNRDPSVALGVLCILASVTHQPTTNKKCDISTTTYPIDVLFWAKMKSPTWGSNPQP